MNLPTKLVLFIRCGRPTLRTLKSWKGVGYYLSTVLDDYSRNVVHWELCSNMKADDVKRAVDSVIKKAKLIAK